LRFFPVIEPLKIAKKRCVIDDIIAVDDGSTDKGTFRLLWKHLGGAPDMGFKGVLRQNQDGCLLYDLPEGIILQHNRNRGKASAFLSAACECARRNATIMFMTDADMINLTAEHCIKFLEHIRDKENILMIRSSYMQGTLRDTCPALLSGFRALRMDKGPMYEVFSSGKRPRRWKQYFSDLDPDAAWTTTSPNGFQLECALEDLIPPSHILEVTGLGLFSRGSGEGAVSKGNIWRDITCADLVVRGRRREADNFWILRQIQPAHPDLANKNAGEIKIIAERLAKSEIGDRIIDDYLRDSDTAFSRALLGMREIKGHDNNHPRIKGKSAFTQRFEARRMTGVELDKLADDLKKLKRKKDRNF
jgi:hypothetical protein